MRKHNRFERGQAVFTCDCCGRRTRNVGQPTGSEICWECYELAGWDNSVNDGGSTIEEVAAERDRLLEKAVKGGGDAARIRSEFTFLWPR